MLQNLMTYQHPLLNLRNRVFKHTTTVAMSAQVGFNADYPVPGGAELR
jgi:hypothetical protein